MVGKPSPGRAVPCVVLAAGLLLAAIALARETAIVWPALSEFKVVVGRAANADDVNRQAAIFVLGDLKHPVGQPIDIPLPQYAYHVDQQTGQRTPCIVVQAEEAGGQKIVGALLLPERGAFAGLLREFELLGTTAPDQSPGKAP